MFRGYTIELDWGRQAEVDPTPHRRAPWQRCSLSRHGNDFRIHPMEPTWKKLQRAEFGRRKDPFPRGGSRLMKPLLPSSDLKRASKSLNRFDSTILCFFAFAFMKFFRGISIRRERLRLDCYPRSCSILLWGQHPFRFIWFNCYFFFFFMRFFVPAYRFHPGLMRWVPVHF
jgi:hypothetical protein